MKAKGGGGGGRVRLDIYGNTTIPIDIPQPTKKLPKFPAQTDIKVKYNHQKYVP